MRGWKGVRINFGSSASASVHPEKNYLKPNNWHRCLLGGFGVCTKVAVRRSLRVLLDTPGPLLKRARKGHCRVAKSTATIYRILLPSARKRPRHAVSLNKSSAEVVSVNTYHFYSKSKVL